MVKTKKNFFFKKRGHLFSSPNPSQPRGRCTAFTSAAGRGVRGVCERPERDEAAGDFALGAKRAKWLTYIPILIDIQSYLVRLSVWMVCFEVQSYLLTFGVGMSRVYTHRITTL